MEKETSRESRRLIFILLAGLVAIGLVVGVPKYSKWRRNRETRREIQGIVGEIRALSERPLVHVTRYAVGGFQGPGGQSFGQLTGEVSGWYRVVQKNLVLDGEIWFLRDRVAALFKLEAAAARLPEDEQARILNATSEFGRKWRQIVPSEIIDDGVDWNLIGREVNRAVGALAKDLEH